MKIEIYENCFFFTRQSYLFFLRSLKYLKMHFAFTFLSVKRKFWYRRSNSNVKLFWAHWKMG